MEKLYENFNNLVYAVNDTIAIVKEYLSDVPEERKEEKPLEKDKEETSYTTKTILVVDDSNIIRNFTKRIFESTYNVGTATNGKEALDILKKKKMFFKVSLPLK